MITVQIVSIITFGVIMLFMANMAYRVYEEPAEDTKQRDSVIESLMEENQRIRFRLRRIEEKLGIKEGEE